jgi:hypothetical protein
MVEGHGAVHAVAQATEVVMKSIDIAERGVALSAFGVDTD